MNLRTCIVCKQKKEKCNMIRIVRTPMGVFLIDRTLKLSGRGAYVCFSKSCINSVVKKRNLNRAFRSEVPKNIYDSLLDIQID